VQQAGCICFSHANKDISARLGIGPRTVEIYRAWVMTKMSARSLADLVHMGIRLGRNWEPNLHRLPPR
jgi:FixJ family two-component response regulator